MGSMMGRRVTSLLAASGMAVGMLAVAVCLVGFLSSYTDESDASAVLAVAGAARPVHVASGGHRHSMVRTAPTALSEETDSKDGLPAKAGLLTALLLGFVSATIPWGRNSAFSALPGPGTSWPTSCRFYSIICLLQKRSVATLSGVSRL